MRSLKIDRKASQPRSRSGRGSARASRASSAKPFGRRKQPNALQRAWQQVTGWIAFRRPVLTFSAGLMLFVVVVGLFVGGYVGRTVHGVKSFGSAVVEDAGFGISNVHLDGNVHTPPESILAALGFEPGQSIFDADVHAARARLMKLDWIADAEVRRRYPDDISVQIVEKQPFALWQSPDDKIYVVERNGGLITTQGVDAFQHLPFLIGAGGSSAADIVEAVAAHRAISARIKGYQRVAQRRWNLILDDGVVVKLPEIGWVKELDALEHLIIDKGILERDVVEIDLRSPSQYFFVLHSGEKKNVPRGRNAA